MNSHNKEDETWADIAGYEGLYQVSNFGRVKSVERIVGTRNKPVHETILATSEKKGGKYLRVHLAKNGRAKWHSVHRLVATAFVEKPDGCDIVNHIDNNPANNVSWNLEWTTLKGNMMWASSQGRMKCPRENLLKAQESRKVPVVAIAKDGTELYFSSQAEAAKALNVDRGNIAACCKNKYGHRTNGGYRWRYAEGVEKIV